MMKGLYADDYVEVFEARGRDKIEILYKIVDFLRPLFEAVNNDVMLLNSIAEPPENSVGGLANQILGIEQPMGWVHESANSKIP